MTPVSETATTIHPETSQRIEVPAGHVGIPVEAQLAELALIAVDELQRLSSVELMKLQSMMQPKFSSRRPTAKEVGEMFQLVGFNFAMSLNGAREKATQRHKEQANAAE